LEDIDILQAEERRKILRMSAGAAESFDTPQTIHGLFEEQAKKNPDNTAVWIGTRFIASASRKQNIHITYGLLNSKANQLAHLLRKKGVKKNTVVGLLVERSVEMITGILAVLKAGGAYLPIDPLYPESRKQYMLQDSQITLLLTNYPLDRAAYFIPADTDVINITNISTDPGETTGPGPVTRGSDLVYALYTSGST
ncbi:MAG: AMP-binding protein, partial [bacterium]|nr:AMP-binding protein [bacterium]